MVTKLMFTQAFQLAGGVQALGTYCASPPGAVLWCSTGNLRRRQYSYIQIPARNHRPCAMSTSADGSPTKVEASRHPPINITEDHMYNLEDLLIPNHYAGTLENVMIPGGLIQDRVKKMARDIRASYGDQTIHLVCILKGGNAFFQDLLQSLRNYAEFNDESYVPFTYDFIRVKSYVGTESSHECQVIGGDLTRLKGRNVLLVEDIIDTGNTMNALLPMLREQSPKSLKVASLLEKRTSRSCGFKANFVGFSIPDKFVVGYCLDYDEFYRDMLHLCVINDAGIAKFKGQSFE